MLRDQEKTKIIDTIEYILKQKWSWEEHIARMKGNRRTKRCTMWQPRRRPSRGWQDDTARKEGATWNRKANDRGQWKALMESYILQWMNIT